MPYIFGQKYWTDQILALVKITPFAVGANVTLDYTKQLVLATGGASGITVKLPVILPPPQGALTVKKVDAGVGSVIVIPQGVALVDGVPTGFALINQWQYVTLASDGSNWHIIANN